MAKLLIAACAALFLFSTIAAKPLHPNSTCNVTKAIIAQLKDLKQLPENTPFVPKVIIAAEDKNLPIKEIACQAVKSLEHLSTDERKQFGPLERHLNFLAHRDTNCTVDPETSQDLQGFVTQLHTVFQEYYFKTC